MCFSIENHFRLFLPKFYPGQKLIPELAEPGRGQLIVMGTLQRTGLAGFLSSSTVEKILRRKITWR